jgi:LAO/AO transport system kinase
VPPQPSSASGQPATGGVARRRRPAPAAELVALVRDGDRRAVARLISLLERGEGAELRAATETLSTTAGHAAVVGLTGAPGVGKSTLASALVTVWRRAGRTVGVLAVDPSSPFTGGALLGDRVRMQAHALDEGVFIRSMATRGALGGLAWATPQAVRVLDAASCDVILIETVGVGQAEIDVAGLADTILVVLAPGLGDAVQVAKAGILEVADILVVNKADREGADQVARDLREMVHLGLPRVPAPGSARRWTPPVVRLSAERGEAVDELAAAITDHRVHLDASGELHQRRHARAAREIEEIAVTTLRARLGAVHRGQALDDLAERVLARELGPYSAADELLRGGTPGPPAVPAGTRTSD